MYLTDARLRERLDEFEFSVASEISDFDPDTQIGPCSIDLRLSNVYWTPKGARRGRRRNRVLDLERTRAMELSPRRGWQRHVIGSGDKITLRPGHMVLARVAERLVMPSDCAGALEGRSSYSRLGLSVHSTGGFINPGWSGHMPLTLVNNSPVSIRIPVGTPLCQLMVIQLAEAPDADYAARIDRKYTDDEGGPSYWWRDTLMSRIRTQLGSGDLGTRTLDEIDELLVDSEDAVDDETLERLEQYVARSPRFGNADELLDGFAKTEKRRSNTSKVGRFIAQWSWALAIPLLIGAALTSEQVVPIVVAAVISALAIGALLWSLTSEGGPFLDRPALERLRLRRNQRQSRPSRNPNAHAAPTSDTPADDN